MNNSGNTAVRGIHPEKLSLGLWGSVYPMGGYTAGTQQLLVLGEGGDISEEVSCKCSKLHERVRNVLRQWKTVKRDPKMDCKIQTCHTLTASRSLRGFCNSGHASLSSRQEELALSLRHVEGSSGSDAFPVSKGREMARRTKAWRMVCCLTACPPQMTAETKSICGQLYGFSWLDSLFCNWIGKWNFSEIVSFYLCWEHSVIWTLSEQPVFILHLEPLTPRFFPLWAIYMPKSISGCLFTFSLWIQEIHKAKRHSLESRIPGCWQQRKEKYSIVDGCAVVMDWIGGEKLGCWVLVLFLTFPRTLWEGLGFIHLAEPLYPKHILSVHWFHPFIRSFILFGSLQLLIA